MFCCTTLKHVPQHGEPPSSPWDRHPTNPVGHQVNHTSYKHSYQDVRHTDATDNYCRSHNRIATTRHRHAKFSPPPSSLMHVKINFETKQLRKSFRIGPTEGTSPTDIESGWSTSKSKSRMDLRRISYLPNGVFISPRNDERSQTKTANSELHTKITIYRLDWNHKHPCLFGRRLYSTCGTAVLQTYITILITGHDYLQHLIVIIISWKTKHKCTLFMECLNSIRYAKE